MPPIGAACRAGSFEGLRVKSLLRGATARDRVPQCANKATGAKSAYDSFSRNCVAPHEKIRWSRGSLRPRPRGPRAASPPAAALCAFTRLEMPRVRKALCRAVLSRQTQSDHEQGATTASRPPGGDLGTLGTGPGTRLRNPALKNTGERCGLRLPAASAGRRRRTLTHKAALSTHGPLPRRRRLRPALLQL